METLVVVSKVKGFIKEKAAMNTSAEVPAAMTKHIATISELAIKNATDDGRKTVMGRDIDAALKAFKVEL
jgi:histone H3/H4